MDRNDNYKSIITLFRKLFILTEGVGYVIIVPSVLLAVIIITGLELKQTLLFLAVTAPIALICSLPFLFSYIRYIKPVIKHLKAWSADDSLEEEEVKRSRDRFFAFPRFHAVNVILRCLILFPIVVFLLTRYAEIFHIQYINMLLILVVSFLMCGLLYYFVADVYIMKISSFEIYEADMEGKSQLSNPLVFISTFLSAMGITLILLVVVNLFYRSVERSYVNQLKNLTQIFNRDIESFYNERMGDARVLLENNVVINGTRREQYDEMTRLFKSVYKNYGLYENVFVSTAEKDSMIVASPVKGSVGLRYRGAGYGDNIDAALAGEFHFSSANKSPVTGLPVVLFTAPIKYENRIIGILGLPIELGKVLNEKIASTKIGTTGYAFIADKTFKFIAHPDKNVLMEDITKYEFGQKMKDGESGSMIHYKWRGDEKLMTFIKNDIFGFYTSATVLYSDIDAEFMSMAILLLVFSVLGLFIIGLVIIFFIRRKLEPLHESEELIQMLSQGELSRNASSVSNDEIGRMSQRLKTFIDKLRGVIRNVQAIAGEVATSSDEMSGTSVSFADNAQNQASSAEEVTATVEQVSAGVEHFAMNTMDQFNSLSDFISQMQDLSKTINEMGGQLQETRSLSSDIGARAKSGEESLNYMTSSMGKINSSSSQMMGIVDIINEISEKINLLSLNAAIEAARAGEAGRGFAVVADEISKLADQTATSIKEIDRLIKSNNDEITAGKANIDSAIETISAIINGVNSIGGMMNTLTDFMKKQLEVNDVVNSSAQDMRQRSDEMRSATEEQKSSMTEIVKSVSNINDLTQSNASGAEQMAGTSESLAAMAEKLRQALGFFKL